MSERYVLVTTSHRGVFAGVLEIEDQDKSVVVLADARCAIYWATTSGFLELASVGPNARSKVGAKVPRIKLHGVTSITDCTEDARRVWEARA